MWDVVKHVFLNNEEEKKDHQSQTVLAGVEEKPQGESPC